jgi:hypothetical protein
MTSLDTPAAITKIIYKLTNDEVFESEVKIYKYSERSIAITASEHFGKSFKLQLSDIGRYNGKLRIGKGWVFPTLKYPALQELCEKISKEEIKGEIPVEYNKTYTSSDGPLGPLKSEPAVVSCMKQLISKLSLTTDSNQNVFMDGANTYVWGSIDKVDSLVKEMNLNPMMTFVNLSHKIVISM